MAGVVNVTSPTSAAAALKASPDAPAFAVEAVVEAGSAAPQRTMMNVLVTRSVPSLKAIAGQQQGFPEGIALRLIEAGAAQRVVSASMMIRK